jgi:signal transduction histidine kinase
VISSRPLQPTWFDVNSQPENYPELFSLAVHELRTPAGVISGYIRMLLTDSNTPLSDRHRKLLQETEKSCARLAGLLTEMSDMGKIDSGRLQFTQRPLDVFELVAQVADLVHESKDRGVRLEVRGLAQGAPVSGDAEWLRRAFDAVLRAVLREKPAGAVVVAERRVQTVDGRRCAVVIVAEESTVQAAYDRPAGPLEERRGGMGLALPLTRRVIDAHGGRIWAPASATSRAQDSDMPDTTDPLARGSAIVSLPLTE